MLTLGNADENLAGFVKATLEGIFSCFDFHFGMVSVNFLPVYMMISLETR